MNNDLLTHAWPLFLHLLLLQGDRCNITETHSISLWSHRNFSVQREKIGLQCVNVWFTKFSCFDGELAKGANLRKPKGATDHFGFCFSLFLFRFLLFSLVLHFDFDFFRPFDVIFYYLVFASVSIFKVVTLTLT